MNHQSGKFTDSNGLYIKLGITNEEINNLAREYCQTDSINPNYLQSIVEYKKLSKYEFDDEIKLLAKEKVINFGKNILKLMKGSNTLYQLAPSL